MAIIELYINEDNARGGCNGCKTRHIVIPAKTGIQLVKQSPRSGQSRVLGVVPLRGGFVNRLDSRLRGNDGCYIVSVMNYVKINR